MMKRNVSSLLALAAGTALSVSAASAQVIFSNCNMGTGTLTLSGVGGLPAGSQWSECARDASDPFTGNTTAGFAGSGALRLADDFVIPAGGANVTFIRVFAYLTGATAPNATAATLRILDGSPAGTPNVIFGDQTTNRLAANAFAPYYRIFPTTVPVAGCAPGGTAPGTTRHVQSIDIAVNQFLAAGTYWIDFNYTGPAFTPCSTVASAIGRQCNPSNSNALQLNGTWVPLADVGQGCAPVAVNQDIYFEINGSLGGGTTGACCLGAPNFSCIVTTASGCTAQSGTYAGDNVTCAAAANCPPPPSGACCMSNGTCQLLTAAACTTAGGTYGGNNVTCAAANCAPGGACCQDSGCSTLTNAACTAVGGVWQAGSCASVSCPVVAYTESGDAGDTPATAALVTGSGQPLLRIHGNIGTSGDADVFRINICNFANFSASVVGGATIDTQLWLFSTSGIGVTFDDDTAVVQSALSNTFVTANGDYYLGISAYDNDAQDASNQELWLDTPFNVERAPDGPGAANPWVSFEHTATAVGAYTITLTGSCFLGSSCYANCDGSTANPVLTANDFQCFLNKFASADPYANCDGSTANPVLTANDFQCFLNKFAIGCS